MSFSKSRTSRPEVFYERGALKNFAKFTGKQLCQSLFFNKVAGRPALAQVFSVNFAKYLKVPFL